MAWILSIEAILALCLVVLAALAVGTLTVAGRVHRRLQSPAVARQGLSKVVPMMQNEPEGGSSPMPTPAQNPSEGGKEELAPKVRTLEALHLGVDSTLGAEPGLPGAQGGRTEDWVYDTAIDWFSTERYSVRAISTRGHSHRYLREVRQDSFAFEAADSTLILSVADGLGSFPLSHMGANLAARAVVRDGRYIPTVDSGVADFSSVAELLNTYAVDFRRLPDELSTTLCIAQVLAGPDGLVARLQWIGDSGAVLLREGQWHFLTDQTSSDSMLSSTVVEPLPKFHLGRSATVNLTSGDCLMLASDGVLNPLRDVQVFSVAMADLWRNGAIPTPAELLQVQDATIRSFDDDRTVVAIAVK